MHAPSPGIHQAGLLDLCQDRGLAFLPFGVFGGLGSRKGDRNLGNDFPALLEIALRKGATPHTVLLAWIRRRWPTCAIPLIGSRRPANLPAPAVVEQLALSMTRSELNAIDELRKPSAKK